MKRKRSVSKRKVIKAVLFVVGLIICAYPLVSSILEQQYLGDTIATYQKEIEVYNDLEIEEEKVLANEYNSILYQSNGKIINNDSIQILHSDSYNSLLNLTGNGIMGSVEIPKINVNLPIYHGTSDEVLSMGVGHIEGTSLPVGGENTRTVLSGHRGLPNSKLFTRLDELEKGDLFFIKVFDEILAYQVMDIDVIEPDDTEKLDIVQGKDLATLLTCTPYGLNTHRLIVTGERVSFVEEEYRSIKKEMMSFRELFFAVIPVVFTVVGIASAVKNRRSKKKKLIRRGGRYE